MTQLDIFITIHALSEWNERGWRQGHCDTPLSVAGERMAALLAQRSDIYGVKAIFTSDLKRSYQTALPLSERIGVPITRAPLLREGNWPNFYSHPDYPPLPFEEPYEDTEALTARAVRCLTEIAEAQPESPILIVTHGAFLRNFIAKVFPERVAEYQAIRTALNHLRYCDIGWQLLGLNDDAHLQEMQDAQTKLDNG